MGLRFLICTRWRNGVGFALFVVVSPHLHITSKFSRLMHPLQAKDCIQLLHLWLAKRELETRRVKDRDFAGVDVRELDLLVPGLFQ